MALPQIYQTSNPYGTSGSPLIFERGRMYPHPDKLQPNQTVQESGAGYPYIVTNGKVRQFITVEMKKISSTQIAVIKNFLGHFTVNYKAKAFTFKDEASVTHQVHYYSDSTEFRYTKPTNEQSFTLTLLKVS